MCRPSPAREARVAYGRARPPHLDYRVRLKQPTRPKRGSPHPMAELAKEKSTLRAALGRRRRALDPQALAAGGRAIARHLHALDAFREAGTIAAYVATSGEVPLDATLAETTARVVYPRVEAGSRRLSFWYPRGPLRRGAYDIPAPDPTRDQKVALAEIDLVLVPGLAFDPAGHRLGRGGGYYDETLGAMRALRIGVAYAWQIIEAVPHGPRDRSMDLVVTPEGLLHMAPKAAN